MSELRVENVSYRYKKADKNALNDISCVFQGGALHAVMGPSGCGKTTLLSILAGLDLPSEGTVFVDGEDLSSMNPDLYRREKISLIFQSFQLFPLLTALENVCYPMEMNAVPLAEAKMRAVKLLENVGIDEKMWKRYPANLSGGEQQRVAIARSLSTGAKILLADEPTGNLDADNSEHIINILRGLSKEKNYCVIIVTHDPGIAASADVVFRMDSGSLAE